MKKLLLSIFTVAALLTSCTKDDSPENPVSEKLHKVKFNIGLFDQTISDFPKTATGKSTISSASIMSTASTKSAAKASDYFNRLEYYLYNSEGTRIANLDLYSDSSSTGFDLPTENLKSGKYTVVFVGKKDKDGHSSFRIFDGTSLSSTSLSNYLNSEITDIFYASKEFEVKNEDASADVVLKRPGGKLKIIIEDEWPANVERIGLSINGATWYYPNNDNSSQGERTDITIRKNYLWSTELVNGMPQYIQTLVDCSWENFIFTSSTQATILKGTITAYNKSNNIITTKNLNDIRVERNKITTVKGKLFDEITVGNKSSFSITVDGDLSGSIDHTF